MALEIVVNKDGKVEIFSRNAAGLDDWGLDVNGVAITKKPDSIRELEGLVNKFPRLFWELQVFAEHENSRAVPPSAPQVWPIQSVAAIPAYLKAMPNGPQKDALQLHFDDLEMSGFLDELDAYKKKHGQDTLFQHVMPEVVNAFSDQVKTRNEERKVQWRKDHPGVAYTDQASLYTDLLQGASQSHALLDLQNHQGKLQPTDPGYKAVYRAGYDVSAISNFALDESKFGYVTARGGVGSRDNDIKTPFMHAAVALVDVIRQDAPSRKGFSRMAADGYKDRLAFQVAKALKQYVPGFPHLSTEAQQAIMFTLLDELKAKGVAVDAGANSNIDRGRFKEYITKGALLRVVLDPAYAQPGAKNIAANPIVAEALAQQQATREILEAVVKDGHHFRDEGVDVRRFRYGDRIGLNSIANKSNRVDWFDGPTGYKLQQKIGEILQGVAEAKGKTVNELLYGARNPQQPLQMTPEGKALVADVKKAVSDEVGLKSGRHATGGKILAGFKIFGNALIAPFAAIANVVTLGKFSLVNKLGQNFNAAVDNFRETKPLRDKYLSGTSQQNIINKVAYGDATRAADKIMGAERSDPHHRGRKEAVTKDKREQNNRFAAVAQTVVEMITSDPKQQAALLQDRGFLNALRVEAKKHGLEDGRVSKTGGEGIAQGILHDITRPTSLGAQAVVVIDRHIRDEHNAAASVARATGMPVPPSPGTPGGTPLFTLVNPIDPNAVSVKYGEVRKHFGVNETPGRMDNAYNDTLDANRMKQIPLGDITKGFKDVNAGFNAPQQQPQPPAPVAVAPVAPVAPPHVLPGGPLPPPPVVAPPVAPVGPGGLGGLPVPPLPAAPPSALKGPGL